MSRYTPQAGRPRPQQSNAGHVSNASHDPNYKKARELYPSFLSLPETLKYQLSWALRGFADAFRWDVVLSTALGDPEVSGNIIKSLLLNTVSLVSVYTFDLLLQPLVRDKQQWMHRNVGWFYRVLWLMPVVGVSLYLNSSWCNLIAKRTFALRHGHRQHVPPASYSGMITAIASSAYRAVMVFTSTMLSVGLAYIPILGPTLSFIFFCWVDSYYCFEFIWIAKGLSLSQRIRHLEERWAYYFAFGLPSCVLCMYGSALANAALFALVLPFYIIMAMHAHPVPYNPWVPEQQGPTQPGQQGPVVFPSPVVPIRLPIFSIVIFLNDIVVKILSVGSSAPRRPANRRGVSDPVMQSVEEGSLNDAADTATLGKASRAYQRNQAFGMLNKNKAD